jgi:hypothetical protein
MVMAYLIRLRGFLILQSQLASHVTLLAVGEAVLEGSM